MEREELKKEIGRVANLIEGVRNWIEITDDPKEIKRLQKALKDLQYQQLFQMIMLENMDSLQT